MEIRVREGLRQVDKQCGLSFASGEIISQLITEDQAKRTHPLTNPNRYQ